MCPSSIGYHATHNENAESIIKNGFWKGTKPGRLGSQGVYVNKTPEGALAEAMIQNEMLTKDMLTVLEVRYDKGVEAVTDIAPQFKTMEIPLNVDSITGPSIRAPGTFNTNFFNTDTILVDYY